MILSFTLLETETWHENIHCQHMINNIANCTQNNAT